MKKIRLVLVAVLSVSLAAGLFALAGCGGGVAATVNGTEIPEQEVTDTIEIMRAQSEDYTDPAAWAQALADSGLTPETLRENVINSKAQNIVLTQAAEAAGYSVDQAAIDEQLAQAKTTVGAEDDAAWLETLQMYGYKDEAAYRKMLEANSLATQLYDAYEAEPTDEELRAFIAQDPTAVEGFSLTGTDAASDEAAATDDTAAEDAAATDKTATEDQSDDAAQTANDAQASDAASALSADSVDLSAIPSETLDQFKELWVSSNKGTLFQEWTVEQVDAADIVINEMPSGVSYNVDMSLAETSDADTSDGSATEGTETAAGDSSSPEAVQAAIDGGLIINDELVGEGDEALSGDTVRVLYTGTLEDGTVFDSTASRDNEPFEFILGAGSVIKGWDAGVVGMKVGGKRSLTIPASLAYGSTGSGSIPADATLTFEIELVEIVK